jgi:HK97 family phage prohead protease
MERRILASEVRATESSNEMRVSGYAARYDSLSGDLGGFKERIAKRAFDRILGTKPDTLMLLNHDINLPLGRTSAGTLTLRGDDKGLAFDCLLPNTQAGRDTHESVKRGDLSGASFAFNLGKRSDGSAMDSFDEEEEIEADEKDLGLRSKAKGKKIMVRTLHDFSSLMDVSVVTYPAYGQTSVAARHNVVAAEVRSYVEQRTKEVNDAINAEAWAQYTQMQRNRLAEFTAEINQRAIDPAFRERRS